MISESGMLTPHCAAPSTPNWGSPMTAADPLVVVQVWRGPMSKLAALTGLPADAIRAKALKPEAAGMVLRATLRSNEPTFNAVKRLVATPAVEDL